MWQGVVKRGAEVVQAPRVLKDDHGSVKLATIRTYGETTHTLIEKSGYKGAFLPGYRAETAVDPISKFMPKIDLEAIDHCVGNQDWNEMEATCT